MFQSMSLSEFITCTSIKDCRFRSTKQVAYKVTLLNRFSFKDNVVDWSFIGHTLDTEVDCLSLSLSSEWRGGVVDIWNDPFSLEY